MDATQCINGRTVRRFREEKGINRKQLAGLLGTTTVVIAAWETSNYLDAQEQYAFATVAEKYGITCETLREWSK